MRQKMVLNSYETLEFAAHYLGSRAAFNCVFVLMFCLPAYVWLGITQTLLRGFVYVLPLLDEKND